MQTQKIRKTYVAVYTWQASIFICPLVGALTHTFADLCLGLGDSWLLLQDLYGNCPMKLGPTSLSSAFRRGHIQ